MIYFSEDNWEQHNFPLGAVVIIADISRKVMIYHNTCQFPLEYVACGTKYVHIFRTVLASGSIL